MAQFANKTGPRTLFAWADVASLAITVGSALDVSTMFEVAVIGRIGRRTGTAFTIGWPNVRIEGSVKASGNNSWAPLFTYQPPVGGTIVNTTLNGAVSANAATFIVTSGSNIAAGDILFLGDSSAANYEIVRVKSISSTTVTPEENVVNAHANAAIVTDQADIFTAVLGITSYQRIRAVVDNAGSGQDISVEVLCGSLDSVG